MATNTISQSSPVHYSLICLDAAGIQKAIEQNGLEPQTIHLKLLAGCFFLYFKIDPFHGCFSEMNLFSAEFTVVSVHYSPALACFHFLNQRLCVGFKTSTNSSHLGWEEQSTEIKQRVSFQIHTSPATACDVFPLTHLFRFSWPSHSSSTKLFPTSGSSHILLLFSAFNHHTISIPFCITKSCSPFKCQLKYDFLNPPD